MNNLSADIIKSQILEISKRDFTYVNCKKESLTYHTFHCCPNCEYLWEWEDKETDGIEDIKVMCVSCMIQERDLDII